MLDDDSLSVFLMLQNTNARPNLNLLQPQYCDNPGIRWVYDYKRSRGLTHAETFVGSNDNISHESYTTRHDFRCLQLCG